MAARLTDLLEGAGEILETRAVRLALIVLIIVSVLPYPAIEQQLRPLFLITFGFEFSVRLLLLRRATQRTRAEYLFLVVDFVALVSFLPWAEWLTTAPLTTPQESVIRLMRIARLLVLLRYSQQLARDVYSVLTRREQLQQFGFVTLAVCFMAFVAAVLLTQLQVDHNFAHREHAREDAEGFFDALWWAFRQLESGDNLVQNLDPPILVTVTSLGLTITGIFIIAYLIGIGTNVVDQVVLAERRRRVEYRNHTIVLGPVHQSELLVQEFVRVYEKNRALRRIRPRELWRWIAGDAPPPRRHALPRMVLLGTEPEPPSYLYAKNMQWVVYRRGDATDLDALRCAAADAVKRAILLAPSPAGLDSDAITIAALAAFRSVNRHAHVFVEVTDSESGPLVEEIGGEGTFPLDLQKFVGLFMCHHLLVPRIDTVFRELLAARGSEIYTHVFVEDFERAGLQSMKADVLEWEALADFAYQRHGVTLIGVLLGDKPIERTSRGLIPVDRLDLWLNPNVTSEEDPSGSHYALEPGRIPRDKLRGLIAVAQSYEPLRACALDIVRGRAVASSAPEATRDSLVDAMSGRDRGIRRLLIIGYSPAVGSLLRALARFVPGIDIQVAISARSDATLPLQERLGVLGLGIEHDAPPGEAGRTFDLERGGRVTVYTHQAANLTAFLQSILRDPVDALVFLSDPDSVDRDARTGLRVLRFARMLAEHRLPTWHRSLQILVEVQSLEYGQRLRQQVLRACNHCFSDGLEVDLVSTDQIKNYFMLHSAFVPGVTEIYHRLLAARGMEIVRLDVEFPGQDHVSFGELRRSIANRGFLPIALELKSGDVVTNPPPNHRFRRADVRAIFGLADSAPLPTLFPPRQSSHSE